MKNIDLISKAHTVHYGHLFVVEFPITRTKNKVKHLWLDKTEENE